MVFGYDSIWFGKAPIQPNIGDIVNKLLRGLMDERAVFTNHSIIYRGRVLIYVRRAESDLSFSLVTALEVWSSSRLVDFPSDQE
jgi:hypothetical protein